MKKRSMFWVLIHHPFKTVLLWLLLVYLVDLLINRFLWRLLIHADGTTVTVVVSVVTLLATLSLLKRYYNKKLRTFMEENPGQIPPKPKHRLLGLVLASTAATSGTMNRWQRGMEDSIMAGMSGPSSYDAEEAARREARRQADVAARARWDAIDRQKKAEYDARDAALRGKDIAARQYSNQADYWWKESRK